MKSMKHALLRAGTIALALALAAATALSLVPGMAGALKVVDIDAGHGTSVALMDDGTVWTWGNEWHGVLGRSLDSMNPIADQSTPKPVPYMAGNLTGITDIAAGLAHVVALKDDGTVMSWGYNLYGQLGDGTTIDSMKAEGSVSLSQVRGLDHVKAVAAGLLYSLALKDDGTVWAWGYNKDGQLGSGTYTRCELTPVQVEGLSGIVKVYAGYNHNIAVDGSGNAWVWGYNNCGELGDGTNVSRCSPGRLSIASGVRDIAPGSSYTLVLDNDGTVRAWGENYGGWLGDGTMVAAPDPVKVKGLDHATAIATGEGISFAGRDDGTVVAWGYNSAGLIGNGIRDQKVYQPGKAGSMEGVTRFAISATHVLGLKEDGSLWAWGDNQFGEIGNGKPDDRTYTPVKITFGETAPEITEPTPAPPGNATNGTAAAAGGGTRYMLMGAVALVCLVVAAGGIIWYSKK